jgi:hypothetical protein
MKLTSNSTQNNLSDEQCRLAEAVRQACLQAALAGYEDARMSGLCYEGAWECAIDAIRTLKLETVTLRPEQLE